MRLTTKCPLPDCGVKNIVVIDERDQEENQSVIPKPKTNSGIIQVSLSHSNHTLIIDVDPNGTVRKYNTIERIESLIDHYIATVANRLRQMNDQTISLIIISNNKLWKPFLTNVCSSLIKDYSGKSLTLDINEGLFMKYGNINLKYIKRVDRIKIPKNSNLIIDQEYLYNPKNSEFISNNLINIKNAGVALNEHPIEALANSDILISNLDIASIFYMVPDEEAIGLFLLEMLDKVPY